MKKYYRNRYSSFLQALAAKKWRKKKLKRLLKKRKKSGK